MAPNRTEQVAEEALDRVDTLENKHTESCERIAELREDLEELRLVVDSLKAENDRLRRAINERGIAGDGDDGLQQERAILRWAADPRSLGGDLPLELRQGRYALLGPNTAITVATSVLLAKAIG